MLNIIASIQLYSAVPKVQEILFDRTLVKDNEAELKIELQTEFRLDDDDNPSRAKLTYESVTYCQHDEEKFSFKGKIAIDYNFRIVDLENFRKMSEEECIALCSNITFIDFRRRLLNIYSGIGMSNIKLPMSFGKFTSDM